GGPTQPARLVLPVSREGPGGSRGGPPEHRDEALAFCYAARLAPGAGPVDKFGSVNPANPAAGRPTVSATVLVLDPDDGRLVAIVEGTTLTALRTSAASALAATLLARPGATTAAVLGPGVQGRGHIRALPPAPPPPGAGGGARGVAPPGRPAGARRRPLRRGAWPAGAARGDLGRVRRR